MKVSKRQLLRIIREEVEAAEEVQPTDDGAGETSDDTEEEPDAKTEAAIRRRVRAALLSESRGAGLFGAIGFHGLGQTSKPDHAKAYHGTYGKSKKNRVVKEAVPATLRGKADLLKIIAAYDRKDEKVLRALGTKRKIMNFLNKLDQDVFDQVYDETDSDFMTDEFEEWLYENL